MRQKRNGRDLVKEELNCISRIMSVDMGSLTFTFSIDGNTTYASDRYGNLLKENKDDSFVLTIYDSLPLFSGNRYSDKNATS